MLDSGYAYKVLFPWHHTAELIIAIEFCHKIDSAVDRIPFSLKSFLDALTMCMI